MCDGRIHTQMASLFSTQMAANDVLLCTCVIFILLNIAKIFMILIYTSTLFFFLAESYYIFLKT